MEMAFELRHLRAFIVSENLEKLFRPGERNFNKEEKCARGDVKCQTADYVLKSLNESADPCEDFYEFACGGWIEKHPVPATQPFQNQFSALQDKLSGQIKDLIDRDENKDIIFENTATKFYEACMKSDDSSNGLKQLTRILDTYGGWPMAGGTSWTETGFDWQKLAAKSIEWSVASLLNVYVGLDRFNSNESVVTIDQASTDLPRSMLADAGEFGLQLEAYKQWMGACASLVANATGAWNATSYKRVESQASDVVKFQIRLAKISSPMQMRKNSYRMYNNMTLRDLQDWTNSASASFKIDWLSLIDDVFGDKFSGEKIGYGERVVVKELDYLHRLVNLLKETEPVVLANYMHWRIVQSFSRDISEQMRNLGYEFNRIFYGVTEIEPRWKDCVNDVINALGFEIGYQYTKKFFKKESKQMAQEMVNNVIWAFSKEIRRSDWMDAKTKEEADLKLKSIVTFVGYPTWYDENAPELLKNYYEGLKIDDNHFLNSARVREFSFRKSSEALTKITDRKEWLISPAVINAFNNPYTNSIILPAAILQEPFFQSQRVAAMNYGSIGAVIGHEILHSFDDTGRLTDEFGNLRQWWSESAIEAYEGKSSCFLQQYNNLVRSILSAMLNETKIPVNGAGNLGENIADNSGMRQAYFAYKKFTAEKGPEISPPALRKYSPDQLFFISYAMTWCESSTKESLLKELLDDDHSPHKVRVLGTVSNSPEFAEAFHCPVNAAANPSKKCILW